MFLVFGRMVVGVMRRRASMAILCVDNQSVGKNDPYGSWNEGGMCGVGIYESTDYDGASSGNRTRIICLEGRDPCH